MQAHTPPPARRRTRQLAQRSALALLLAGTAMGGFAAGQAGAATADTADSNAESVVAPKPGAIQPVAPANKLADFSDLVAQVKPAVVSITSKMKPDENEDEPGVPGFGGLPFGFPFGPMLPHQRARVVEARGSGFLIDPNGTVVTNNHVVKNAQSVTVTLDDGTELPAKVVGTDSRTDLAVLRIHADHKLPFINLGDSNQVRPGQWVVAVGNPFGLDGSVTAGIVSARGRDIGEGPYDSFIQVDAPINQGNSGGPLFTQDGKVVGVNTAILSPTGGSVGIGFAIPSNTVKTVVAQLERSGHVTRGYLGVETQPITAAMSAALNLPHKDQNGAGALVASVQPDSPAATAGLQPGDVITSVNGQAVADPRDLAVQIAALAPGSTAHLALARDGATKDATVTLANLPDQIPDHAQAESSGQSSIGISLSPLTSDLRDQLGLSQHQSGAVITGVRPDSLAASAGLREGDVVVSVGNKPVQTAGEARDAINAARKNDHAVALRILRDGQSVFVAISGNG